MPCGVSTEDFHATRARADRSLLRTRISSVSPTRKSCCVRIIAPCWLTVIVSTGSHSVSEELLTTLTISGIRRRMRLLRRRGLVFSAVAISMRAPRGDASCGSAGDSTLRASYHKEKSRGSRGQEERVPRWGQETVRTALGKRLEGRVARSLRQSGSQSDPFPLRGERAPARSKSRGGETKVASLTAALAAYMPGHVAAPLRGAP